MKGCPACNFSFPDSHDVCDFDGTTLVPNSGRALVKASPRPSRLLRFLKSPMLLASLAMLGLFLSAVLVGYYDSNHGVPPIAKNPPSSPSLPVARATAQPPTLTTPSVSSKRSGVRNLNGLPSSASLRRQASASRSMAKLQRTSDHKRVQKPEITRRSDAEDKDPKLVAILKTTWRVLKKPFDF